MGVLEFPILIIKKFNEIYFFAINCACLDENPLSPDTKLLHKSGSRRRPLTDFLILSRHEGPPLKDFGLLKYYMNLLLEVEFPNYILFFILLIY